MRHKSVRLSELLRKQIMVSVTAEFQKNALKAFGFETLTEVSSALMQERSRVADSLWDKTYGGWQEQLKYIPDWALAKCRNFMAFQEDDSSVVFKHATTGLRPCRPSAGDLIISRAEWGKIFTTIDLYTKLHRDVSEEMQKLRNEVSPILDSVGSTKQLLEVWPSMENFLPPHIADPDSGINLPALNISRLQQKIMGEKI